MVNFLDASMKTLLIILFALFLVIPEQALAQSKTPTEDDYYKIYTLPVPEGILLEIGGVATLSDGRIGVATRRGDVWIIENPYMQKGGTPRFTLFASGLHEALGLAYKDDALYAAQRGELTKLVQVVGLRAVERPHKKEAVVEALAGLVEVECGLV